MPTKVFLELDEDKKKRIKEAALAEFAQYGFEESSTNRIVKECGISKGSLFKYFENKEDLYFFLTDETAADMMRDMAAELEELPKDLKKRIITYSVTEISWYIANPLKGRFMISLAAERGSGIYEKIIERYGETGGNTYRQLLKGAKLKGLEHKEEDICNIIKWVLLGYNESFLKENGKKDVSLEKLKEKYIKGLNVYLDILFKGL